MTYGPHTPTDRQRMLDSLGLDSVDQLFADIPDAVRARGLDLPPALDELTLARRLEDLAARNRPGLTSLLGAGA
jgi:glycine dehydrogenase subunit 1